MDFDFKGKVAGMDYPGKTSPDEFMAWIVAALNNEVSREDVYPLMATYSGKTCDCDWLTEGGDYVCVNIKRGDEIFVIDIYPYDSSNVVLALFRRKDPSHGSKSLYKMTHGTKYKNGKVDPMISAILNSGSIGGFIQKQKPDVNKPWFGRMEKSIPSTDLTKELCRIVGSVLEAPLEMK